MVKNISILGSTGSIGTQTLEVVRYNKDIKVTALAAGSNVDLIEKQIREFKPEIACLWSEEKAKELKERVKDLDVKILYIEAEDEVIIKRYKETRRKHPLDERFGGCLHNAIAYEREQLLRVKGIADYYIETSYFSASQLKEQIREIFLDNSSDSMSIKVTSFGFKYGVSTESDLVFDVRCLPNPYYIPELRHHTGCEKCVQEYVMSFEQSRTLLEKLKDLLDFLIPLYIQEGKSRLVIAFGCTGGKHRSITFTELIGDYLISKGMHVVKQHRDIGKDRP